MFANHDLPGWFFIVSWHELFIGSFDFDDIFIRLELQG